MFGNCKFEGGGSSERDCECKPGTCRSWKICNEKHTCSCGHITAPHIHDAEWKKRQKEIREFSEKCAREDKAARAKASAENERLEYERLKAKFERDR